MITPYEKIWQIIRVNFKSSGQAYDAINNYTSIGTVFNYFHRTKLEQGLCPLEYLPAIISITGGDVTLHDLRPDYFDINQMVIIPPPPT